MAKGDTWGFIPGICVNCEKDSQQIVKGSSTRLNGLCWSCASEVLHFKQPMPEASIDG